MKSTPRVPSSIPLIDIGYKYNSRKVLGFIATQGTGCTEPGDPYLSNLPDIYSNVSVRPVVHTCLIGGYVNACNAIDNHNRMQQSDLALQKYWVTQSGYFRLSTIVALGMGIADGMLIFCYVISQDFLDKNNSAIE